MLNQNIVFLYDTFKENGFPMMNGYPDEISWLIDRLHRMPVYVDFANIHTHTINSADLTIYPIELVRLHFNKVFDNINPDTLSLVRDLKIPIFIYFPTEGFNCKRGDWIQHIHQQIIKHRLEENNTFCLFGNLIFDQEYKKYVSDYSFKKVFPLSYFEWWPEYHLEKRWQDKKLFKREYITEHEFFHSVKKYNFLSYNGNFRTHRIAMVSEILRNNLQKESLLSFSGGSDTSLFEESKFVPELLDVEGRLFFSNYIKDWKPVILDFDKDSRMSHINNIQKTHYLESYFSLIAETEYDTGTVFLTEKTFKAIKSLHPFIIYGNPGSLDMLRKFGYQTFPELFCEDYDSEEDHKIRLQMIIKEVKRFSSRSHQEKTQLVNSIKDKLIYNRNVLESRAKAIPNEVIEIFKSIKETEINDKRS